MQEFERKCYPGNEPRILVTPKLIENNSLAIHEGIAREIMRRKSFLGFEHEVAIEFISFEAGKDFWKEDYIQQVESGHKHVFISDVYEAVQDFLDYMVFAWMKAMDERGISATRSIAKLATWMEILGRKDIATILQDDTLYYPYGRPALRKACATLGIAYPKYL